MSERITPIFMEDTAREIANVSSKRFGPWIISEELTTDQRKELLDEVLAGAVHDGIMAAYGIPISATHDEVAEALQLATAVTAYISALTDIEKGQGRI